MTVDGRRIDRTVSARAERLQAPPPGVSAGSDALMLKVAAGDHEAFEALYLRLAPGVFGLALCVVGERAAAEEVTRGVFATLWTQAPSFDTSLGTVRTWAMTLTHRLALAAAVTVKPPEAMGSAPPAKRPADDIVASTDVGMGLGVATDQQRLAIALAYFGGLAPDEVARAMGVPAPTVTTQIRDGLRRLGRAS